MKRFEIVGNYTAKDAAFAAVQGALPVLLCNELQLITKKKVSRNGKVKSYPIKALICRATLNTPSYAGRYILVDKSFKGLSKRKQLALLLRENLLELSSIPTTEENSSIGFTTETDKAAVNSRVMEIVGKTAFSAFMKAEKILNLSAKRAVCKSGMYKANKKAKYTATHELIAALKSAEDINELDELLNNTPVEELVEAAAEIYDEAVAASTPSEAEPEQPVQEVAAETVEAPTSTPEEVEVAATEQQPAPEPKPQPNSNGKKKK